MRFACLVSVGLFISLPAVEAALAVSPTRVVLQAKPNKAQAGFFTLENRGKAPLEVTVEPEDWSQGIGGERGPVEWLTVRPKELTLKPGKKAKVTYAIRVPKQASGELRAQVFFTTHETGGSSPVRSRLGTIIYVGIQGTERIDGAMTRVSAVYTASTPGITRPDRFDVLIGIHNRGNAHIVPEGKVVIRDREDVAVATIPLQWGWGLLPQEEDAYHAIGSGVHLKPGPYTLEVTIACGGDLRRPITITKTLKAVITEDWRVQFPELTNF